ncbi:MAG: hypothetical protein ABSF15_24200 [Candidatus Sulfotelmatobacter sp.]
MFEGIKSILGIKSPGTFTVNSGVDHASVPMGFFRVRAASGKETLGYKSPNITAWDVRETVNDGGNRVTLTVPRSKLPLVKLDFSRQDRGVYRVNGLSLVDMDAMGDDGTVGYGDEKMREGVDYI